MLEVSNLSVEYPTRRGAVRALDDVSFSLGSGESLGIAGESACGKSTLGLSIMRMLSGGKVTSGSIEFEGRDLLRMPAESFDSQIRWRSISMMFQGAMNSLDPVFTVQDQFAEIMAQHGFDGDRESAIHDAVKSVNLDESVLAKYPHELSGGMKQRIVIAMALILRPRLVISDEPTTALDVLVQAQIINLLKDLRRTGLSIILISHDLALLSELADKVAIMYGGQIVEFGPSSRIYQNPEHPYTAALLKSIPRLRGERPSYIPGDPPSLLDPPRGCRFEARCPEAFAKCGRDPPSFGRDGGSTKCWLYE